jgi:16S rRNA (guanine527-N7)-methyltransferase
VPMFTPDEPGATLPVPGAAGAEPPLPVPPPAAAEIFGPALGLAQRYAGLLAGPGVERGLLGPAEAARLWERHLLNCAVVAEFVPPASSLVDLGSGAGLPGIVLAMLLPDVTVTLLEPMGRRAAFLAECIEILGLGNAEVLRGRAEELAGQLAADVVTARAVAPMYKLVSLAAGLVKPGGVVLAIKGAGAAAELSRARPELRRLGARDAEVLHAGGGRVNPAATVIRFTAGQPRSRVRRPGGPGGDDLKRGGQGLAGSGSGRSRGVPRSRGRGRKGRG